MFRFFCMILPLILFAVPQAVAGKKKPDSQPGKAIVFINSAFLAQTTLVHEINRQLAYSQQIQRGLTVTIIDIHPGGNYVQGPANYIKDESGIWVGKYRPTDIPGLFCLKKGKMQAEKLNTAQEIRRCL